MFKSEACMKCAICSQTTVNPEGICGFCMLHNTLADYKSAKEIVENMPTDNRVVEFLEGGLGRYE